MAFNAFGLAPFYPNNQKPFAVVELYQGKNVLFFDDSDYHLNKIGTFITQDFDITIGALGEQTSGQITAPSGLSLSSSLKIGDIANVMLVNFTRSHIKIGHTWSSDNDNQLMRTFSISSIDGRRLVLDDYVKYNHSYTTVGYVGQVIDGNLVDSLNVVTSSEFRAYPSKHYTTGTKETVIDFSSNSNSVELFTTTFWDNFTSTNVKPYDVICKMIKGTNATDVACELGAIIDKDDGGTFVHEYLVFTPVDYRQVIRFKQGADFNYTPAPQQNISSYWFQPENNADNYIFGGRLVKVKGIYYYEKDTNEIPKTGESDSITTSGTRLMAYSDVTKAISQSKYNNLTPRQGKEILKAVAEISKYGDHHDPLYKLFANLSNVPDPFNIEFDETSFYTDSRYPTAFDGTEVVRVFYNGELGGSLNGVKCRIVSVKYSPNGRNYKLRSIE